METISISDLPAGHARRVALLKMEDALSAIAGEYPIFLPGGIVVKTTGAGCRTYLKGTNCAHCGAVGVIFCVESHEGDHHHLRLYAKTSDGALVAMTSDHIVPKSKNGPGGLKNRQPLCVTCNQLKGNNHEATHSLQQV